MQTYKITNQAIISKQSWENGETEQVNAWDLSATIEADNPLEAIKKFFADHLYYSFDKEAAFFCEDNGANSLQYSNLVDENNEEIVEGSQKMQDFKNGKEFYTANNFIKIFELVAVDLSNDFNN